MYFRLIIQVMTNSDIRKRQAGAAPTNVEFCIITLTMSKAKIEINAK